MGLFVSTNTSIQEIFSLPDGFVASLDEIKDANESKKFGSIVSTKLERAVCYTSAGKKEEEIIVFKLFGFIPIRKVKVSIVPEDEVFVGGVPIGVCISTSYPIVVSQSAIDSENGAVISEKTENLQRGDFITEVNGKAISSIEEIENLVNKSEGDVVEISFLRNNKVKKTLIKKVQDNERLFKLGVVVKDDVSGIGTLTYVNTKNNKFGALGHAITEQENVVEISSGNVYSCSIFDIQKGERNNPGQLKGVFMQTFGEKGCVEKNNKYGVFGTISETTGLVDEVLTAKIGGRLSVTPGKAKIVSSVSGIREEYDIEIIKANYQSTADDKSLVIRVTDPRLLALTGGIVQGMSGSPILQNGKLIGAVTHVFTSDPTKGYGVYSDWMVLNE